MSAAAKRQPTNPRAAGMTSAGCPPEMQLFRDEDFNALSDFLHERLESSDAEMAMALLCAAFVNSPLRATVSDTRESPVSAEEIMKKMNAALARLGI